MLDTKTFLQALSTKWSLKWESHQARILKGLSLALAGKVAPRGLDSWRVCGSKKGVEYTVTVQCGYPSCTCPDYTERKQRCKHVWACALLTRLAEALEEALATLTPTTPKPAKRAPLNRGLAAHCAKLHTQNHQLAQALPLAEVIPIRRHQLK